MYPQCKGGSTCNAFLGQCVAPCKFDADCPPSFYFPPPADYTVSGLYCDAADRLCKAPVRRDCDGMVIEIGPMHGA